ncbi:hypothetical protein MJH12_15655 [bacterium]|nr:hypothetical protein [bacterium]
MQLPPGASKVQRVAEIQEELGEVYVPSTLNIADSNRTIEFDIHPLEQISLVQEKLLKYAEATANEIEDDTEASSFRQSMDITRLNLESFNPTELTVNRGSL